MKIIFKFTSSVSVVIFIYGKVYYKIEERIDSFSVPLVFNHRKLFSLCYIETEGSQWILLIFVSVRLV